MSYIELDDKGIFNGVFSLYDEIAGTEFYDGLLIPVNEPDRFTKLDGLSGLSHEVRLSDITENVFVGNKVHLYRIHCDKIYTV
jgi:hypothetical protein